MATASAARGSAPIRQVPTQDEQSHGLAGVPQALTSFVGRQREIEACSSLLTRSDVRILTLTGPGGAGKTRLAMQLGQERAAVFDVVWFVGVSAIRDPDLIMPTIAEALGVRETGNHSLLERIVAVIAERPALLVLDNFEQVLSAAPQLTDLVIRCPNLKLLVTSRELLHLSGEQNYPVPPLAVPARPGFVPLDEIAHADAVTLFVQRATAANPGFVLTTENGTAIVDICARLDGLPLAIELAAAQSRLLSPSALLSRFNHRLTILTGGPRDQPQRLQTMRDAIAWSHDLLTSLEQRLFRRISVFVDGFTLEAAEIVGEQGTGNGELNETDRGADGQTDSNASSVPRSPFPVPSVLSILGALLDKSLVRQEPGAEGEPRFRMLETIREFGLERLAESTEETAIRDAHATYYLNFAQQADLRLMAVGSATWVERMTVERANLREAIAWALDHDWAEPVLRLAGSFAYARGLPAEELAWIEVALKKRDAVPVEVQVNALFTASALAQVQGDFAKSNLLSEDGLAMSRASGYLFGEGRALLNLGITAEWQGDLERAASFYEASHHAMQQLDGADQQSHLTMLPLANLGDIALLRGEYARAAELAREAVARWREDGYIWGIAQGLGTVAAALCEAGDQDQAASLYEESLAHWLDCDIGRGVAGTIAGIAGVARSRGQLEQAARLLGAAWGLCERLGVRFLAHHLYAERVLASVRARMDTAVFQAAWDAGQPLSLSDAVTEARSVLASTPVKSRSSDGLTTREREVLRLLTAGHPDREIAAMLSISPRTVQSHVAGLFAKLGVNTRAEAAATAVRRGLV